MTTITCVSSVLSPPIKIFFSKKQNIKDPLNTRTLPFFQGKIDKSLSLQDILFILPFSFYIQNFQCVSYSFVNHSQFQEVTLFFL